MFNETKELDRRFNEEESGTVTLSLPSYDELCHDYYAFNFLLNGILNSMYPCKYGEDGVSISEKEVFGILKAVAPLALEGRINRLKSADAEKAKNGENDG